MSIHTTDAIVLRRYLYRETSIIVSCLSQRYGRLKGLVKGLRAHPNRYRSAMEPLTVNRIVFYDTRSSQLHLISQCELLAPLPELQRDLETMRSAARCIELVEAVVPAEEPQPVTYQLLKETLERMALGGVGLDILELHFILRLLRLAGFQPQLSECTGCNSPVQREGFWSAGQGGLLCRQCLHQDPQAQPMPQDILGLFQMISAAGSPPALDGSLVAALRQRLDEFLRWRLEHPLRTLTV